MPPVSPLTTIRDSRAVVCSWSPPPLEHQNGLIVEYRVNVTEMITERVFLQISTSTSLVIESLHPDYVYLWVVTAVTIGVGPYTTTSTIRTPEDGKYYLGTRLVFGGSHIHHTYLYIVVSSSCDFHCTVPTASPQSPAASALSSQSIQLSWLSLPLPDQNGVITGYVINITSLDTGVIQQLFSTSNSLQVSSLDPFTVYSCIIAARTAIGPGPFTRVLPVQTLEDGK